MFVRNCWYVAAWDSDIAPGQLFPITIINEPVVLYRTADERLVALEDRCCHRFAPLSKGRIEDGCNLRCMYHGLKFEPSGRCIEIPGQDKIPDTAKVRTYAVVSRHSWIWIWMGEVEDADEGLIPPAVGYDNPDYILRHGNIDYDANYQLINDNLTDFSHLSFVHANSFGATEHWARSRPSVKAIDRGIRVSRWIGADQTAIRDDTELVHRKREEATPVAMYQRYDFLAPGILLMYSASYRPEDMPEDGVSPSTGEPVSATFTSQAVTPMTDKTSRYFFSWGPRAKDGGPDMADAMMRVALMAFGEDREIIEAQQRIIDLKPGTEVLTTADVGPVQMRAAIRKLYNVEHRDK